MMDVILFWIDSVNLDWDGGRDDAVTRYIQLF